jgi:hypothetical protein
LLPLLGSPAFAAPAPPPRTTTITIEEPALQFLADRLAPTLAANEKRFRGRTGPVAGFGAGSTYPQLWLRDSSTLLDLSRYYYPREHLTSWIEEHLAHQQKDGSLFDWIAAGPASSFAEWAPRVQVVHQGAGLQISADKNTVEADQESSAVIAAAHAVAFTGDAGWLEKDVAGQTVLARCDAALSYLVKAREDAKSGLVTSGFTADWGDVSPTYADQRVIYLDDKTPRVVGLYTNALAYEAALGLAAMQTAARNSGRAAFWAYRALALQTAVDRLLWQPARGFYRMHAPAPGPAFDGKDDDILAMGGHAAALRAGLLTPARARRVLDALEQRRRELKLATVSFNLMPPYPAGVFQNPAVKEPWTYQNGGQWDWFGGRLIAAEFESGRAMRARAHLQAVAAESRKAGGLFEWRARDGAGKGSAQYAGSAGALGAALIEGLLGVRLRHDRLDLQPRLGAIPARAHLEEPATGAHVEYDYRPRDDTLTFTFDVQPPRPTAVGLLIPEAWTSVRLEVDGTVVRPRLETTGTDRYARIDTQGGPHRLVLSRATRALRRKK